jgi:hypothetical protein
VERGQPGFALCPEIVPLQDESVVVKRFCSAFQGTELAALLAGWGTLIGDAHTTFDNAVIPATAIIAHHNATLAGGFVTVREGRSLYCA